ncbi:hypothetical protein NJB1907f44_03970 [Mycobacterium marinum]|nr:UDP-glucose 4-epimerase [Mycobacterium marinum]GJN96009.1 hypothetical protein NJB1907f34b_03180 [Mycobacterium marinum]GJO04098.1 hypothetical protein NJB1907E90_11850 [Mycobacterium marinum]GJO10108.1 hypothetical protein NJB1808e29_45050 [Mycobacterium marinum]GJO15901.1 hypothetical protein NJB1728e18_08880 [Mycobacterium marinum]
MTSETVLNTGAFGQVGKRCTEILLRRGHTVVAMDLATESSAVIAAGLQQARTAGVLIPVFIDLTDGAEVSTAVARHRPTVIVHLAAIVSPPSYRNPRMAHQVNVGGTRNLVTAAQALTDPPLFVFASSAAVYGSRNPHRQPERITATTPVNPIDQYGENKVLAELAIAESGLPYAMLRLGGVVSPNTSAKLDTDYLLLMRATPTDNRMHSVDARDVALAFANAVARRAAIEQKVLVIGGRRQPCPPDVRPTGRRHVRGRHRRAWPVGGPTRQSGRRPRLGLHRLVRHHRIPSPTWVPRARLV